MKWLILEALGWLGIAAGALFVGFWLTGNLYAYGI